MPWAALLPSGAPGPNTVVFEDGTTFEADVIIACTGFVVTFPFLEPKLAADACNARNLFKHSFHPDLGAEIVWAGTTAVGREEDRGRREEGVGVLLCPLPAPRSLSSCACARSRLCAVHVLHLFLGGFALVSVTLCMGVCGVR